MKVTKTKLDGVLLIEPTTIFKDFRGGYVELYNEDLYHEAGIDQKFIQDDIAYSSRHVLRGIHGDAKTWKLFSCLSGSIFLAVVNWDEPSPQYMQCCSFELSEDNRLQVLVPPKSATRIWCSRTTPSFTISRPRIMTAKPNFRLCGTIRDWISTGLSMSPFFRTATEARKANERG